MFDNLTDPEMDPKKYEAEPVEPPEVEESDWLRYFLNKDDSKPQSADDQLDQPDQSVANNVASEPAEEAKAPKKPSLKKFLWIPAVLFLLCSALGILAFLRSDAFKSAFYATPATPTEAVAEVPLSAPTQELALTVAPEVQPSQVPVIAPTQQVATLVPLPTALPTEETLNGDNLPEGKTPEFYFPYGEIRVCTSVNGPWIPAFNNEETYIIDPASEYFTAGHHIQAEGVVVGSFPLDLHQNFILTEKVEMSQGNFWDCGDASTMTKADKLVNLFDNNNGKWGNWDSQKDPEVFHPMLVITPYGDFPYAKGERPAWVRGTLDLAASTVGIYTCSYDATELHEQDALPDQQRIITPGSAGCDFVAVRGSEAARHNGVIERYPYKNGMLIFVFNPELSNSAVEDMLATNFELDVTVVDAP